MSRKGWLLAGAASAMLAAGGAAAEGAPSAVDEVVVTAAPYAVSERWLTSSAHVITREALDVAPSVGLGDLLSGEPGVRSSFFGPGASRPVIRGLSGPRVLILQNGLGQIDASDASPDHAVAADPDEADRIEILRGPSTLAYGGSGIGGVVNVIDERVPSAAAEDGIEGHLSGALAGNGEGASAAGHLKLGRGPWVAALQAARRTSDDYRAGGRPLSARYAAAHGVAGEATDRVRNTDVELKEAGGGLAYVGGWGFVGASARKTRSVYGLPYSQIAGAPPGGEEGPVAIHLRQTRYDLRGEVAGDFGPFAQVKFAGGHADYRHFEQSRTTGEVGTNFLSKGEEGRLELVQQARGGWQGAVGLQGLRRDFDAVGEEAFVPPTRTDQAGIFTLQRLDKGGWGLEGGVRLERTRVQADQAGREASAAAQALGLDVAAGPDRRSFTAISGSAAVFLRPSAPWFLSLSAAHNERAPTQFELFADGPHAGTGSFEIGDPNLKTEAVNSLEATARYTAGRLALEAHLYYARYQGFIQETPTGGVEDNLPVQQFQQLEARFWGGELTAGYDAWRDGDRNLRLEAAYDYVRGTTDAGPAPRIPPWSLTARAIFTTGRAVARAEVRHVAGQDRVADNELPTDSYTTLNLFASYRPIGDQDLRIFVEGRNLTDAVAREHASFLKDIAPLPGRNLRVGVAYAF